MEMDGHESEVDGSMSNNDEELSDIHDDDSDEHIPRTAEGEDADILSKLKQQVRDMDRERERVLEAHPAQHAFPLPLPFPFPHPAAAFLPPVPPYPAAPPHNSSGSSHSSESSNSSQQHTWSFEEQFKQVRQLYEISDDPKRKEFLDDLFSFMQKRGTPINRLPIMAKSVLDLYELYNLVIARGGLVDVINKKLWQEIIKGLHLPSSITSAAFTLRTQYMKYLYNYECEKKKLSSPLELQAAIDGNRREGRRTSYGGYPDLMRRSPGPPMPPQMSQMSPLGHLRPQINGNGHMPHPALHPALAQPPLAAGPISGLAPADFEVRVVEYMNKMLGRGVGLSAGASPPGKPALHSSPSPPTSTSPREALSALEMSRLTLWNLYNNNHTPTTPEPQKEALDLGLKEETKHQITSVKREPQEIVPNGPPSKKSLLDESIIKEESGGGGGNGGAHIKINSRSDSRSQDGSLSVSMEINGTTYQGVLFAQTSRAH